MKALARAELRSARVERRPDDHKGIFGHALVVAGSAGMSGAAILTARAALRSGAGLVTLALPASLQSSVAAQVPEAMTMGLPETAQGSLRPEGVAALKNRRFTVLAIGPGLSTSKETVRFVFQALDALDVPAVIDADALNGLAGQGKAARALMRARKQPCIVTPHFGEMARCLGMTIADVKSGREIYARRLSQEWNAVVLLKGHPTLICDGQRAVANSTGGPGLAKGGSGDVLTGLIAGLWAQMIASSRGPKNDAFLAAGLGAYLHGAAGDAAEKARTPWAMTALDVLGHFADAFKRL